MNANPDAPVAFPFACLEYYSRYGFGPGNVVGMKAKEKLRAWLKAHEDESRYQYAELKKYAKRAVDGAPRGKLIDDRALGMIDNSCVGWGAIHKLARQVDETLASTADIKKVYWRAQAKLKMCRYYENWDMAITPSMIVNLSVVFAQEGCANKRFAVDLPGVRGNMYTSICSFETNYKIDCACRVILEQSVRGEQRGQYKKVRVNRRKLRK